MPATGSMRLPRGNLQKSSLDFHDIFSCSDFMPQSAAKGIRVVVGRP
jgi:hypothetical protein